MSEHTDPIPAKGRPHNTAVSRKIRPTTLRMLLDSALAAAEIDGAVAVQLLDVIGKHPHLFNLPSGVPVDHSAPSTLVMFGNGPGPGLLNLESPDE